MQKKYIFLLTLVILLPLLQFTLPWWVVAVKVFILAFVFRPGLAFSALGGFLVPGLTWMVYAIYINIQSEGRIGNLLGNLLGELSSAPTILLSGILIGIICLPTAISGNNLGKILLEKV